MIFTDVKRVFGLFFQWNMKYLSEGEANRMCNCNSARLAAWYEMNKKV